MSSAPRTTVSLPAPSELDTPQQARRAMAGAMIAIGRATDPLAEFQRQEGLLAAAMDKLGRSFDARQFLQSCGLAAACVSIPLDETTPSALPRAADRRFRTLLRRDFGVRDPSAVELEDVVGGFNEGYDFTFAIAGVRYTGYAVEHDGHWVFAPGPVCTDEIATAAATFRRHFDFFIAVGMHARGVSDTAIEIARAAALPTRALWPHERDPRGLIDDIPLVFVIENATGNDRKFFCAVDPFTGEGKPYDHP
jgi:hypothetical protein